MRRSDWALLGIALAACHSTTQQARPVSSKPPPGKATAADQCREPRAEPRAPTAAATGDPMGNDGRGAQGDVEAEVKRIIKEQLDVDEKDIRLESRFVDDLGADSLGLVELVLAFEEAFELDIPDEDTEAVRTVGDAVRYVESHVEPARARAQGGAGR
jgi:acyl carrier protein